MSKIQANNFVNRDDTGAPDCSRGLTVSSGLLGVGTTTPATKLNLVSGTFRIDDGTTALDSFVASSEGHIGCVTNHKLNFVTNNTIRATVDTSGNFGIGTPTPDYLLDCESVSGHVIATGVPSNKLFFYADSANTTVGTTSASSTMRFNVGEGGSNEKARIDSSGRLLVGTTSSASSGDSQYSRFQVRGNTYLSSGNGILSLQKGEAAGFGVNNIVGTILFADANGGEFGRIDCTADAATGTNDFPSRLVFSTTADGASSPTERMRIDNVGRFGLGTTNPTNQLTVSTNADGTTALLKLHADADGTDNGLAGIKLSGNGGDHAAYIYGGHSTSGNSYLSFYTDLWGGSHNPQERVRIDSSGRLLVGTTSARANYFNSTFTSRFQVEGTSLDTGSVSIVRNESSNGPYLVFGSSGGTTVGSNTIVANDTNSTTFGSISFQGADNTEFVEAASIRAFLDGTPGANDMPGRLVFSTTADGSSTPTERMRIDNVGRMGLGTTPDSTLHVYGGSNAPGMRIGYTGNSNYFDADIQIFRTNSGTERMRIDDSGRLLVGTSTASGASRVDIVGNSGNAATEGVLQLRRGSDGLFDGYGLGAIRFGDTISGGNARAEIIAYADGTGGTGDLPTRLTFWTTADGASGSTERMRIGQNGYIHASNTGSYYSTSTFHELSSDSATDAALLVRASNTAKGHGSTSACLVIADYDSDYNGSNFLGAWNVTNNSWRCIIRGDGDLENVNNSYGAISDAKLKENIVDASSQWDDLKALQVRNYNFKEGQTHTQIGLIAQEVELVSPGLVSESPDRDEEGNDLGTVTKSVNYSVLYMKAVKALQEAMERIEMLEAKVTALEGN